MLKDKDMPALDVFTAAISYMKDHFMRTIGQRMCGIVEEDIRWVLTVPAIWDAAAKQFKREAAEKVILHSIYGTFALS